ncbi:hypothetical protein [Serinicoccus hydrothermalis]|uniref:hypothetical protein n=1 Tax=Serinicoccus hydrothermalis TaxID=1758689 RepID=UPI000B2F200F|nr:hypothetical protein [Serinicoccus hydrothermalis]
MTEERVDAALTIHAPADAVFAVLTDPRTHAAIDGTGWVDGSLQEAPLREPGQLFRMRMYHRDHPDGYDDIVNEVLDLEAPHVVSWRPGYVGDTGGLEFGGWVWRYDLQEVGPAAPASCTPTTGRRSAQGRVHTSTSRRSRRTTWPAPWTTSPRSWPGVGDHRGPSTVRSWAVGNPPDRRAESPAEPSW